MANKEIKESIQNSIKRIDSYRIDLTLWHSADGSYNEISVYNNDNNSFESLYSEIYTIDEREDNKENTKILKAEQIKMYNYLLKHFKNINIKEANV